MDNVSEMIAFGPIPSRRLGKSLGINNIPPKSCTYSCVYCQAGRTRDMTPVRREFYRPRDIERAVKNKVSATFREGGSVDYLSFVPEGEPTLDINLGREIDLLKPLGIKIAVITNSSMLGDRSVRDDLCRADWVSVKIDAVSEDIWRKVDRPHKSLELAVILEKVSEFAGMFKGFLATETMLVRGFNEHASEIEKIAEFISGTGARKSYLSVPTRPPMEKKVTSPDETDINTAYQIFTGKGIDTEYLIGYEGNAFAFTGDVKEDLLSVTAVHPMTGEAVADLLDRSGAPASTLEDLLSAGSLKKVKYSGRDFYVRKI